MNQILHACGLESRPRWIDLDSLGNQHFQRMCSNCGEIVNRRIPPKVCPSCKSKMKAEDDC